MTKKKIKVEVPKTENAKLIEINEKLQKINAEVLEKVNWIKARFNEVDPKTRKNIAIGLGAAAAGLIALAGIKKQAKKK